MNKFPFTDRFNRCLQVFAGSVTWFDKDKTFPSSFGFISELVCSGMQQMGDEQSFHPQLAACMQNQT